MAATAEFDQGDADAAMPIEYASLILKPAPGLEQFLAEQQNPASANFRKWLSPEQFAARFGGSENDIKKITSWLRSQGLKVHDVARGRLWITFSGSASEINRAFQTRIRRYRVPTPEGPRMHFANATDPVIPEALAPIVSGFDGLHDFHPRAPQRDTRPIPAYNISSTTHRLAPDDFATIYNVKPLYAAGIDGTGQKIAVIGRTNISLSDVRTFRAIFKLPDNDPQVVLFGPQPDTNLNDQLEAHLDVQWAGAVAPNATIVYVNSRSVSTSVQYAIDQNIAPVITYSYGSCETADAVALSQRYLAQQANAQGITWIVASGDWGVATCDNQLGLTSLRQASKGPSVSRPASLPEVTAIGGTVFADGDGSGYWAGSNNGNGGSALGYIPEAVWNDPATTVLATGGGRSAYFAKPYWQTGPGVPNDGARDIPDISLSASALHVPYLVLQGGTLTAVGGTSAGAPAFAGVVALLNQALSGKSGAPQGGLGNINPSLYRMAQTKPSAFHDITDGDNRIPCAQSSPECVDGLVGYSAGPGYDLVTGLGTINAAELVNNWDFGTPSDMKLSADPANAGLDDDVQLTANLTVSGPAPTGSVTFLVDDSILGDALLTDGVARFKVPAQRLFGGASNGVVTAQYGGNEIYAGSGASATVTLKLPESGSTVVAAIAPNPVPQGPAGWSYTVSLTERNGVATKLTRFFVDGVDNSVNITGLGGGNIAAKGNVSLALRGVLAAPRDRVFEFGGQDADGREWSTRLTVPFVGPPGPQLTPQISLSSTPATGVMRNAQADAACPWSQQLTVHELSGFNVQLAAFTTGNTVADNLTSQISRIFGTTRLPPFGSLTGKLCFADLTPGAKTITIAGTAEAFSTVTSTIRLEYSASTPAAGEIAASPKALALSLPGAQSDTSETIALNLPAEARWSLSLAPNSRASAWLKVTPQSGTGPATLTVQATGAGLSNGAYLATILVETASIAQQYVSIPVSLTVGASDNVQITGIVNHASLDPGLAPGMLARINGTNLAGITRGATSTTLPLRLGAVSVTVNGISAPISSISPGQLSVQIPYEVGAGPAIVAVNNNGQLGAFLTEARAAAPGLYSVTDALFFPLTSATRGQNVIVRMTGDGDTTNPLPTGFAPAFGTATNRLPVPRLPVTVTVGDVPAKVDFVGIRAGSNGVSDLNFAIPAEAPTGTQSIVVTVGGVAAKPLTLEIR